MLENMEIYLQEIMRNVAASLMAPVMIVLVALILFAVYSVGALLTEFLIERRHFKANMPRDIKAIKDSSYGDLPAVIEGTGLLRRQKEALQVIVANMGLPEDDLFALAKAEVSATDARYRRKVARTDLVTKIAPMMGLMCTLIPLGPGIVAMGQGEVNLLSNSLLVAFDGTVAGLIGGVVSMVVSSVRKRWYANYLVAMESLTTCVLEKAQEARTAGVALPYEGDIRARADSFRSGASRSLGRDRAAEELPDSQARSVDDAVRPMPEASGVEAMEVMGAAEALGAAKAAGTMETLGIMETLGAEQARKAAEILGSADPAAPSASSAMAYTPLAAAPVAAYAASAAAYRPSEAVSGSPQDATWDVARGSASAAWRTASAEPVPQSGLFEPTAANGSPAQQGMATAYVPPSAQDAYVPQAAVQDAYLTQAAATSTVQPFRPFADAGADAAASAAWSFGDGRAQAPDGRTQG